MSGDLFKLFSKRRGWQGIFLNARDKRGGGISRQFISGYIGQIFPDLGTRQEATQDIIEYIVLFYNRQRRQEKLGYLAPAIFERRFYEQEQFTAQLGVLY